MDLVTDCFRSLETTHLGRERIPVPGVRDAFLRPESERPYVTIGIAEGLHLGERVVGSSAIPQPNQAIDLAPIGRSFLD